MEMELRHRSVSNAPWTLALAVVGISALGIYNLVSAARPPAESVWKPQLLFLGMGLVAALVVALVDPRLIRKLTVPLFVANLIALVALRFVGTRAKGALSWFQLGPFRVQPAEFMKIALVLMLARYFHQQRPGLAKSYSLRQMLVPLAIAIVPIGLVLSQPDLGTALMLAFTSATLFAFAGLSRRTLIALGILAAFSAVVLWNDYLRPQSEPRTTVIRKLMKPHQDARIRGWLDPSSEVRSTNYHATQSKIAVGSGGAWGKGWKKGTQTGLRFLPEQHTDFIFSVFAEEQGFVLCMLLLALYSALIASSLAVALAAKDRFGVFVAVGITAMIFWQIFENIGMVTGLVPITGLPLPLMSYGGSSLISTMIGIGLLVNVAIRRGSFA